MPNPHIGEQHLRDLFQKGQLLYFQKDELLIHPRKKSDDLFYVESGFVRAFTITTGGDKNIILLLKVHEIFPLSLLDDTQYPVGVYYEAKTRVTARKIKYDELIAAMRRDPHLEHAVLMQVVRIMQVYAMRIKNRGYRFARERVRYYLVFLGARFGVLRNSGDVFIDAPITHQDIANSLNMTRETVTREVQQLIREGIIEQQEHSIVIKDHKKLVEEFEE